jgi:hypothetical protein
MVAKKGAADLKEGDWAVSGHFLAPMLPSPVEIFSFSFHVCPCYELLIKNLVKIQHVFFITFGMVNRVTISGVQVPHRVVQCCGACGAATFCWSRRRSFFWPGS